MQPNAHVHPAFAGVLNNFAAIPRQVAAANKHDYTYGVCLCRECEMERGFEKEPLVKCRVSVKTEDGDNAYEGLFPSTCDAVIDAQTRIGMRLCKVSVRAIP